MKKTISLLAIIILGFSAAFLVLHIGWRIKEKRFLNVYILDKTVSQLDRPEHKSLVWILNSCRYVQPNNKSYSYAKDYFGFCFPLNHSKA